MSTQPSPPPLPEAGDGSRTPRQPTTSADVFNRIRAVGIVRPDDDRWVAGVASGLARRSGLDPVLVRGAFVALSLLGVGLFLYGIGWLLLPQPDGRIHAEEVTRGTVTAGFVGSLIAIISGMSSLWGGAEGHWLGWGAGPLPLILVGALVWWLLRRRRTPSRDHGTAARGSQDHATSPTPTPPPAGSPPGSTYEPPAPSAHGYGHDEPGGPTWTGDTSTWTGAPSVTRTGARPDPASSRAHTRPYRPLTMITVGAALLAGVVTHLAGTSWPVTGAVCLAVVGVGLVVAGLAGRRGGLLVPAAFLAAFLALGPPSGEATAAGQQTWAPASAALAEAGYQMGAGEAVLDLTSPDLLVGATASDPLAIPVQMGAGELTVTLPRGSAARVETNLGAGEVLDEINNRSPAGLGRREVSVVGTGPPLLVVTVNLGLGQVRIVDAAIGTAPTPTTPPQGPTPTSLQTSPTTDIGATR